MRGIGDDERSAMCIWHIQQPSPKNCCWAVILIMMINDAIFELEARMLTDGRRTSISTEIRAPAYCSAAALQQ